MEAEKIRAILGAPQDSVRTRAQATETAVRRASAKGELAKCRYIHFAVHGVASHGFGRSPGVLLTMPDPQLRQSATGLAQEDQWIDDGTLDLEEIATLRLNADLVVLSACRSVEGRFRKGEGITGLARAFVLAGSRGVVCSLWSIDDRRTSGLMQALYAGLQQRQQPADALRNAQLQMIQSGEPPFYWAPFIYIGGQAQRSRRP